MTFIDLASIGCGRYEGFWTIAQFWPTVRRHTAAAHQKTQILAYGRTKAKTSKSDDNERNHVKWKRKIFLASDFHKEFKSSWYNTPKSKRKYKHHPIIWVIYALLWDVPKLSCFCEFVHILQILLYQIEIACGRWPRNKKKMQGSNQVHKWSLHAKIWVLEMKNKKVMSKGVD